MSQTRLLHLLDPREDGINLEGEAPSLGLGVVLFQHVDPLAAEVLPVLDGFFDPDGLWELFPQDLEEGGFAAADVALNGEAAVVGGGRGRGVDGKGGGWVAERDWVKGGVHEIFNNRFYYYV